MALGLGAIEIDCVHPSRFSPDEYQILAPRSVPVRQRTMSEQILDETLLIYVRQRDTDVDAAERVAKTIEVNARPSPSSGASAAGSARSYSLRLTDPRDMLFLLELELGEEEFAHLRTAQSLLVDFAAFPAMLSRLLQDCRGCSGEPRPSFVAARTPPFPSAVL
jgi:hypothetical protein